MSKSLQKEEAHKIILLGDSCVGKTSLANRWINDTFDEAIHPTVGASNYLNDVVTKNGKIRIALWDTAGQEQYRSITPLYVRGAELGIIVASIVDDKSIGDVRMWMKLLYEHGGSVPAILVISKIDLLQKCIDQRLNSIKSGFANVFYVSSKTGEGVDHLFNECAMLLSNPNKSKLDVKQVISQSNGSEKGCC